MRLIDVDAIKKIDYGGLAYIAPSDYKGISKYFYEQLIASQPIAYDVDKVVRQLERNKINCNNSGTIFDTWDYVKLEKAIEIVKGGKVKEKNYDERLTTRVEDKVYYSKGEYPPTTLCAETETWEVRECMKKLAEYEDLRLSPDEIRDKVYRNRWLPVSEGLPKESRYYLCTVEHYGASTKELLDIHDIKIQVSTESMFFNKDNKRWGKWNDVNNFKVTAWQPLPEPYEEVKE